MNYLIEPYNPYEPDPKKKKKHWMQIAEEEALFHQIQLEEAKQQSLREAQARTSNTLPPNAPVTAQGHAGPAVNAAGGGGGRPETPFFAPRDSTIAFAALPSTSGSAPFVVQFANNSSTDARQFDTFTWNFGDGTSTQALTPVHVYNTGSFFVSMTASSPQGTTTFATQIAISASMPVIVSAFTPTQTTGSTNSGSTPFQVAFTNTSTGTGISNYLWIVSGSTAPVTPVTTSVVTNPTFQFVNTGSYFITLQVTGSYGANAVTRLNAVNAIT